jgi:predicted HTH transcriptional regulator
MKKIRVFISSVQSEFAEERRILSHYMTYDALLGKFFEPFIFENVPAVNYSATSVYSNEVEHCDIYLGVFGKQYGFEDSEGVSPTEREFDLAGLYSKTRLVFLSNDVDTDRDLKERNLIQKAQQLVVRKRFASTLELKTAVYVSLIRYLEENEYIRTTPFDATLHTRAVIADLDSEKIAAFVGIASAKRGFPFSAESPSETILTHLNLMAQQRVTNAAILLFAKNPQQFFISSEIKCAHFHGTTITKPIPSYHVYKGDVFQLVNQAVDFVLSRIDVSVGTREESIQVPIQYELPPAAVTEAIVNAVAHRDYTSNGSIQVMLFKDRLEIWNPGSLPYGLTTAKLRKPHSSIPSNPLLAEPMYLAGFIERMGTGTGDIIRLCDEAGLKKAPEFLQEEIFKTILWRKNTDDIVEVGVNGGVNGGVSGGVSGGVNDILVLIENNPGINVSSIKSLLNIPQRTIERWINQLKKENKIEFKGAPKTGGYFVINTN